MPGKKPSQAERKLAEFILEYRLKFQELSDNYAMRINKMRERLVKAKTCTHTALVHEYSRWRSNGFGGGEIATGRRCDVCGMVCSDWDIGGGWCQESKLLKDED